MSSFYNRDGDPEVGDIAFDKTLNENIYLIDKVITESQYSGIWVAEKQDDTIVIVSQYNFTNVGYYGD